MEVDLLNTSQDETSAQRQKKSMRVVNLGLAANAVLAVAKIAAGILGRSKALLADGINSVSDVVYFIFVKILVKLSGKPADAEHPYGHHQFESIAGVVIGAFVITTGIAIFWDSVNSGFDMITGAADRQPIQWFTLLVAGFTIVTKVLLMWNALAAGKKTGNMAVAALAKDHRNDIFASLGAAVGITLGLLGFTWVDPLAGAVVAVIVAKTGIDILRESSNELMDTIPDKVLDRRIREAIAPLAAVKAVESVHLHRFGPFFTANITIAVDGGLSVAEGDRIADEVEAALHKNIDPLRRVYIHYHPMAKPAATPDVK